MSKHLINPLKLLFGFGIASVLKRRDTSLQVLEKEPEQTAVSTTAKDSEKAEKAPASTGMV